MQHMEMKISNVTKLVDKVLNKLSNTTLPEGEQEKIDIFQNLPIKNKNELEAIETKLANDESYRKEMVNITQRIVI